MTIESAPPLMQRQLFEAISQRNLSRGGELIELRRKHRPERPVKLVVLLDVSGSISVYSQYLFNFVRGNGCDTDSPAALAVDRDRHSAPPGVPLPPEQRVESDQAVRAPLQPPELDYVDCFATAHSLASLAALEDQLARLRLRGDGGWRFTYV